MRAFCPELRNTEARPERPPPRVSHAAWAEGVSTGRGMARLLSRKVSAPKPSTTRISPARTVRVLEMEEEALSGCRPRSRVDWGRIQEKHRDSTPPPSLRAMASLSFPMRAV